MLKIRILALGEDKDSWVTQGIEHYTKLLKKHAAVELVTLPSPRRSLALSPDEIKRKEAALFRDSLGKGLTVALSDSGKPCDSPQFAKYLERWQSSSGGTVTFIIGGPWGLDQNLLDSTSLALSLSPLTFSHQLVRLVLLEQLYRGFGILHNTAYHK